MSTPNKVAFTQCTVRSTRSKRSSGASTCPFAPASPLVPASGGIVVASVRTTDPPVDVVAAHFPVARFDLLRELDAVEPLARLVPIHRGYVEPHRPAVFVGERRPLELVGDDDVAA